MSPTVRPPRNRGDQRGVVMPSPVVLLSIVAVVMAGIAFIVTRDDSAGTIDVPNSTFTASPKPSPVVSETPTPTPTVVPTPTPTPEPIRRGKVKVVVLNNTSIKGLAATVGERVDKLGWNVVGADNWRGSVPKSTVYYPRGMKAEASQLAADLGLKRVAPAVKGMSSSALSLVLTGPLR